MDKNTMVLKDGTIVELEAGADSRKIHGLSACVRNIYGTFTEHSEGVSTSFCFREKDKTEKRLDAIEEGQTVQDGTIMDMAGAVSTMAGA